MTNEAYLRSMFLISRVTIFSSNICNHQVELKRFQGQIRIRMYDTRCIRAISMEIFLSGSKIFSFYSAIVTINACQESSSSIFFVFFLSVE